MKYDRPFLFPLCILIYAASCTTIIGQPVENNSCSGNLLIINWIPSSGSNGPQISTISLNYEFVLDSVLVTKRYKLNWQLGDFVNIDGKRYSKTAVGEQHFEEIEIKQVVFKAGIYSKGKYIDDIVFDYHSKVPRSGGESGWYISGDARWNKLFDKIPPEKAAEICKKGFEVRNPQIFQIEFDGLDRIKEQLTAKEEKDVINKEKNNQKESNTKAKKEKPQSRKRVSKTQAYFRELVIDLRTGNVNRYKGNAWHIDVNSGLGFVKYPINVNSITVTSSGISTPLKDTTTVCYKETGYGYGLKGGLELWPMFGNHWAAGGYGSAFLGWAPRSLTFHAQYGVKAMVGAKPFFILAGLGSGIKSVSWEQENGAPSDAEYSLIEGKEIYNVELASIGIRTLISRETNKVFDFMVSFEKTDYLTNKWIPLWGIDFWWHNKFKAGLEFSLEYDSPGEMNYPKVKGFDETGFYISIYFSKAFDFFGRPYLRKKL